MVDTANPTTEELVERSEYAPLYGQLRNLETDRWLTTFEAVEAALGFALPMDARTDEAWWYNRLESHSPTQALAWSTAGWFTFDVDLESETVGFRRRYPIRYSDKPKSKRSLDEILPVRDCGGWPESLDLSREANYGHRA